MLSFFCLCVVFTLFACWRSPGTTLHVNKLSVKVFLPLLRREVLYICWIIVHRCEVFVVTGVSDVWYAQILIHGRGTALKAFVNSVFGPACSLNVSTLCPLLTHLCSAACLIIVPSDKNDRFAISLVFLSSVWPFRITPAKPACAYCVFTSSRLCRQFGHRGIDVCEVWLCTF